MRTEAELIQVLLDSKELYVKEECSGLCILTRELLLIGSITLDEEEYLDSIIEDNKPNSLDTRYYFPPYQWQPRKEYLENLLKKYKR